MRINMKLHATQFRLDRTVATFLSPPQQTWESKSLSFEVKAAVV